LGLRGVLLETGVESTLAFNLPHPLLGKERGSGQPR